MKSSFEIMRSRAVSCVILGLFSALFFSQSTVCGDLSYTVQEEMKHRYVIGNVAKDLGLDALKLSARKARVETEDSSKR
ncbi:protocadherin beta-16-like, partial [Tachysurus ichikawai]